MCFHLVGVHKLIIEMDALYIRGMLNNPDLQPNATINWWIAAILLFNFKLIHVPMEKHHGPDGLSWHKLAEGEDNDEDDPEDWIDRTLALGIWVVSWLDSVLTNNSVTTWTLNSQDEPPHRHSSHLRAKTSTNANANDTSSGHNSSQHSDSLAHSVDNLPSLNDNANPSSGNNGPSELPANNLPPWEGDANIDSTSDTNKVSYNNDAAPSLFPQNEKTTKADDKLVLIHHYLSDPRPPPHLRGDALTRCLRRAARFSLANGRLWRLQADGRHQLYIALALRFPLVRNAHNGLGHKGFYSTHRTLLDHFWWPLLDGDVKWYVETCHQCQLCQTTQVRIPPTIATPAPLFRKVYIDTMFMPLASGFWYIVQARCLLTAWPEWHALRTETGRTLGTFIFKDILCRWGVVEQIVTDNGTTYVAALDWLSSRYGIHHIRISAYNL
jgi:hypothetical protein